VELLNAMHVFSKVATLGSFTRAAEALRIGRPRVTHVIQELEASLGVRLFHRTTRKVILTAEGERFHARVSDILNDIAEATSLFEVDRAHIRGRLRIDLPVLLAENHFITRLREFHRAHPNIKLVCGVTDRPLDLVAEGIDCAVRIGPLSNSSLVSQRLGMAAVVTCAAPSYLREFGPVSSLDDLAHHRAVNWFSGASQTPVDWHFTVDGTERTVSMASAILVNNATAYIESGLAGFGVIQAFEVSVLPHIASGALVEILPRFRPRPRPVWLLYPSKIHLAPHVKVFIEWAKAELPRLHGSWLER
jgi:LysR family transcriptional regulator, regulator for bpeEF and oprC